MWKAIRVSLYVLAVAVVVFLLYDQFTDKGYSRSLQSSDVETLCDKLFWGLRLGKLLTDKSVSQIYIPVESGISRRNGRTYYTFGLNELSPAVDRPDRVVVFLDNGYIVKLTCNWDNEHRTRISQFNHISALLDDREVGFDFQSQDVAGSRHKVLYGGKDTYVNYTKMGPMDILSIGYTDDLF